MSVQIGDYVEWESQARGTWSVKRGRVLQFVPPGVDVWRSIPAAVPASRLKGSRVSKIERVLVEVVEGERVLYYTPRASQVKVVEGTFEPKPGEATRHGGPSPAS